MVNHHGGSGIARPFIQRSVYQLLSGSSDPPHCGSTTAVDGDIPYPSRWLPS